MSVRVRVQRIVGLGAVVFVVAGLATVLAPRLNAAQEPTTDSVETPAIARHGSREVQVFFSRWPESDADFSAVFPVSRTAPDAGVARAALRALIAGPTPAEAAEGYFSVLGSMLVGPSSCGGADFSIRIEAGLATVQFCREISSGGIGQDARAQSAIEATLRQFSTVQHVRLLTSDGHCLFDMTGEDRCLTRP